MRKNVVSQLAASGLLVTTLCSSFLPSLVMAQSIEQADASTTLPWALEEGEEIQAVVQSVVVEEDVQAPVVEVTPEVAGEDPQTDGSDKVTKKEIKEALENISGLLDESANVEVTKDADSAAIVETAEGVIVDLPKDPSDAVVLSSTDAPAIEITLPQADESKKAKTIDDGVVAYPGRDGSANAIQATEDGGVKMLTVIDNAGAPIEYTYGITVPEGGRVELTSDGGAVVLDIEGQPIAMVTTPWAVDAAGVNVDTYFTTDGVSLTQHILHNVEGISYPVTADPWVWKGWVHGWVYEFNRKQTIEISAGMVVPQILSIGLGWVAVGVVTAADKYIDYLKDTGRCVALGFGILGPYVYGYSGSNCK